MPTVKTKHFEVSVYEAGSIKAPKLALILPGRLESKDYAHIRSHAATLAALGYQTVALDPPGSWESPGSTADYTITNYLAAANDLIDHYGNKPTLLIGHSLGGSVAILTAAENPAVVGIVLLMTAVRTGQPQPDIEWQEKGAITFDRDAPPGDRPGLKQRHFELPYSYYENAQQYDTKAALVRCKQPKLFIAGIYDAQVPLELARQTVAIAPEPKQFIEVPSYHGYRYSEAGVKEIDKLIGTFASTL